MGGVSEWFTREGEPIPPINYSLRHLGRGVLAERGSELPSQATPPFHFIPPQRPRENPESGHANMLGADLRRPRRRLSSGPGLGWAQPETSDPRVPLPPRPTTLPLRIPPRISITRAENDR